MTQTGVKEQAVVFGQHANLVGVISGPPLDTQGRLPAVILLSGGLLSRVGPRRVHVRLARVLASMGFTTLRFDLSGIGDSGMREDNQRPEESLLVEAREAMDYLSRVRGASEFVLQGFCSGAWLSFAVGCQDPRVVGLIMVNAQGFGEEWTTYDRRRKMARYYQRSYLDSALRNRHKWLKVLSGRADYRAIARVVLQGIVRDRLHTLRFRVKEERNAAESPPSPVLEMIGFPSGLRPLVERGVRIMFVFSEGNTGLEYLQAVSGSVLNPLLETGRAEMEVIPQSDHTFTLLDSQAHLIRATSDWVQRNWTSRSSIEFAGKAV